MKRSAGGPLRTRAPHAPASAEAAGPLVSIVAQAYTAIAKAAATVPHPRILIARLPSSRCRTAPPRKFTAAPSRGSNTIQRTKSTASGCSIALQPHLNPTAIAPIQRVGGIANGDRVDISRTHDENKARERSTPAEAAPTPGGQYPR